jgi:peptide/nickel transport system substrate-binding protein
MRKTSRLLGLASVVVASAVLIAGCSSSGGGSASPSASSTGLSNAAITTVVRPSTTQGGTLNVGALSDCDSWDPARTYYANCWVLQRLFTRTLMAYAPVPGTAGSSVVPDLATTAPTTSADGRTWTFTTYAGLKWQDGTPLTTSDIKYGLERLWATDVINGGPSSYYLCLLDTCDAKGNPQYAGPYKDKTGQPMIDGKPSIVTPNATTIVFHLAKPFSDFQFLMATPTSAPVEKAKDTGTTYTNNPQSSGPFMIQSYKVAQSLVFVRNPNWSQATDKVRHPLVNQINLGIYSNAQDLDKRLQTGLVDFEVDGGVLPTFLAQIVGNPTLEANADNPVTGFTRYLVVFQTVKPLDNIECRKAVFYALNKNALRLIRGGSYGGDIATTMMPSIIPGSDTSYNPYPNGADHSGDLAAAKQALTKCGHPSGFSMNMAYTSEGLGPQLFTSVQSSLGRVGIKLSGKPQAASSYYSTYIGSPSNVVRQGIGLAIAGWGADFPSGYGFYNSIANGNAILPVGNSNYPSLNDPKINGLLNKFEQLTNPAQRAQTASQIDKQVMANAVYLPFQFDKSTFYRNQRTTNIYLQAGLGSYYDIVNVGVAK